MLSVHQTFRGLRRSPWFSLTMSAVVGLAIALAGTVFAIVDGVLFKPIDLPDIERLFEVEPGHAGVEAFEQRHAVSAVDIDYWTEALPDVKFTGFSAQRSGGYGAGVNEDAAGVAHVLPNFFDVVGVHALVGGFGPSEFQERAPIQPVIITYDLWQGRYRSDPNVIGREVFIDRSRGAGYRIVGIMPRGFVFPTDATDVSFIGPLVVSQAARTDPQARDVFQVIARVPAGSNLEGVRVRIEAAMARVAQEFPRGGAKPPNLSDRAWQQRGPFNVVSLEPLSEVVGRRSRPLFFAVFASVLLLLGLGALNVSSLAETRLLDRSHELRVRRALGAGGVSLACLVLLECALLIGLGGVFAFTLLPIFIGLGLTLLPDELPLLKPIGIDGRVAAFVLVNTLVMLALTSLKPIRRAVQLSVASVSGAERAIAQVPPLRHRFVIGCQVAGVYVLAIPGSLLIGSLVSVYTHVQPIRTKGVVVIETFLQGVAPTRGARVERAARVSQILGRLAELESAELVAATSAQVLRGGNWQSPFVPPEDAPNPELTIDAQGVTPDYYRLLQPELVSGRLPSPSELDHNEPVLVISETVAKAYWPANTSLGKALRVRGDADEYRVVGVVRDVRWLSWDRQAASIYGPYDRLSAFPLVTLMIWTRGSTGRLVADALRALDSSGQPLWTTRASTLEELFVDSVRMRRFRAWLFGAFTSASLLVLGVGVFGLVGMSTARRSSEMAVRQALGATRAALIRLLCWEQMKPVAFGLAIGALVSGWSVNLVETYLYELSMFDPRIWLSAAGLVLLAALAGVIFPVRKASRTNLLQVLRVE